MLVGHLLNRGRSSRNCRLLVHNLEASGGFSTLPIKKLNMEGFVGSLFEEARLRAARSFAANEWRASVLSSRPFIQAKFLGGSRLNPRP